MQKIFGALPQRQSGTSPLFLRACGRSCSRRLTGILALTALSVAIPALAQDATTSVLELDTVTIKATYPRPEEIQQALTPGGVTIVGDEKLQESPVGNLTDSVRYVPGVWAPGSGNSDDARISIRGSNLDATDYDNNGVLLLQDGLPVSSADGNNHNRFPDPLAAQRMIVMRGANALTYGASELGGAINFVSRTARSSDPMQLSVDGGSFGLRSARVSVGAAGETLDGLLTVEGKHDSGWREHSRQKRHSVYGNVGLRVSPDIDLRFYATHIDNEQQLAGSHHPCSLRAGPAPGRPVQRGRRPPVQRTQQPAGKYRPMAHQRHQPAGLRPLVRGAGAVPPHRLLAFLQPADQHAAAHAGRHAALQRAAG